MTTDRERRPELYAKADAMYAEVPYSVKCDLFLALEWARDKLMRHEGDGHYFEIGYKRNEGFYACFSKPQWPADHVSQSMETAQEAIVMAVCEYLNGV